MTHPSAEDRYKSLLVIITGLLVLHSLFVINMWESANVARIAESKILLYVATGVAVASIIIPAIGKWIVFGWLKLAEGLGWVNSKILLSVVFFVIMFPVAILFRMSTKNPLQLKNEGDTIFDERNHQYTKKDLEKGW